VLERVVLLAERERIDEAAVEYALVTEAQGQPVDVLRPRKAASATGSRITAAARSGLVREWRPVMEGETIEIAAALKSTGGNKSRAAQALGLTLRQLNYRIRKLGVA